METGTPASWVRRLNAATLDLVVYVALLGVAVSLDGSSETMRLVRLAIVYGPLFLLEPLLIRVFGATIGQRVLHLRVTSADPRVRLTFPRLTLRYWMKIALGSVSLLLHPLLR